MTDIAALLAYFKKRLRYEPETGKFYWINAGARSGIEAGTTRWDGYRTITINNKKYLVHRLVWLFEHGTWPGPHLDHDDHNPSNNKIGNLIDRGVVGNTMNRAGLNLNNSSGHRGVQLLPSGRWQARVQGKYLGASDTKELAAARVKECLND